MLDNISTNETHFFRERHHFDFLSQSVFPRWLAEGQSGVRPCRARIWCAGCSSGEEPYSVAMTLLACSEEFLNWDIRIVGTDLSSRVLETARAGIYSIEKLSEIPIDFLRRFMLRGVGPQVGKIRVAPEIRSRVEFARLNLNRRPYRVSTPYDIIFCRNVLIYFDTAAKQQVAGALLDCLAPGGLFLVGHSENLHLISNEAKTVISTVYTRAITQ